MTPKPAKSAKSAKAVPAPATAAKPAAPATPPPAAAPAPAAEAASDAPLRRTVKVTNRYGIHARPAALLVKAASKYGATILLEKDGIKVNAKSIMGLLTLEGAHGSTIIIHAQGVDAPRAIEELADLFANKFFED